MQRDPLAQFRRGQQPRKSEPEQVQASDEHRALKAAIDALNEIPNAPLSGAYKNTYALIPVLETVWEKAERGLEQQRANVPVSDAEIDAAVDHDLNLIQETIARNRQEAGLEPEPDIEP